MKSSALAAPINLVLLVGVSHLADEVAKGFSEEYRSSQMVFFEAG